MQFTVLTQTKITYKYEREIIRWALTFMLDPYSLVDGVVSPITPLMTFSDERPAIVEFVRIDDLPK